MVEQNTTRTQKELTNDGMIMKQYVPKVTLCESKDYHIWQQAIYYA